MMKDKKPFKWTNIRRRAAILLVLLIILAMVLGQMVFASNDGGPIRSAHKVKAGDKSFCFFVANNVTLTQSELAGMDDETLVNEILKRTGLFIKEASCNDPQHPLIPVDEWIAAGNTLGLSEEDIAAIRAADPAEGKSAKFHMDIQFTLKPEDKEPPAEEPGEGEDPGDDPSADPGDDPAANPGDDPAPEPGDDPAPAPGEDPAPDTGDDPAVDTSDDTAADQGETPKTEPGDASSEDTGEDPEPAPSDDPTVDPGDDPAPDPSDDPSPDPGDDPAPDPSDDPAPDPSDDPEDEQPEEREIYTTYKLTSPELLFVVIVRDEDAGVTEDECDPVEPALPEEPEIPEMPEIPDIAEPTEMLPEYRKIDMVDKSGAPLTPVLEDGEPVELTWIEPKNTIDPEKAKNWIESFPGGEIGFGGLIAALAAAGIGIFVTVRKREDE